MKQKITLSMHPTLELLTSCLEMLCADHLLKKASSTFEKHWRDLSHLQPKVADSMIVNTRSFVPSVIKYRIQVPCNIRKGPLCYPSTAFPLQSCSQTQMSTLPELTFWRSGQALSHPPVSPHGTSGPLSTLSF